jgi:rubrerythrin
MDNRLLKKSDIDILKLLEQDLQGEYDAINQYNDHIAKLDNEEIKNKLIEIRNEEEVHAKEIKELINKYLK